MAFSRHNIEKRRLIELVRLNPILWDCRLPHYKRSDKRKAIKWNELGRLFNVSGERVQRTFTSLREIFRRELNHEKMLGTTRFKSKWEYYDAMAFLKEVIRERKSRERIKHGTLDHAPVTTGNKNNSINNNSISINSTNNNNNNNNSVSRNSSNNNSNGAVLDEYQYFAPSDPNNPNNQPQPDLKSSLSVTTTSLGLKLSQLPAALQQQAQHLQALQLQPDVTLTSLQKQPLATSLSITTPVPLAQTSPAQVLSSSRSCSSSPSIYIKDEPCSPLGGCPEERMTGNGLEATRKKLATIRPQTKQQLKARLQLPTPKNSSAYATSPPHLIINANNELIDTDAGDLEEDLDDFDEDDDVTGHCSPIVGQSDMMGADGRLSVGSIYIGEDGDCGRGLGRAHTQARHVPTSRELLYMKFGEFLAARLNTLHETVANELMNKMLLLIAEK
ncbi:myb-like protein AA [Drosophila yakuba]|uniref:myb-like protein AA n=1 Tax=Drosophila yakuba TaxID=7245 RepID=UPI001930793F|nr:myb-like protein AA [Drosophila yakuba]XP_039230073.1 myb-like protein AA [Drosophila yakuba]XP_039230074.1 myb-like protein AA [Drosophila yakuba]XP_039230075.1 myb-like protein AA [Drosophila yakuba]XP_039230076.1 myb-like protein AA [Drosophila yakuba]XP_039230077.1 myb-like protein AA [Drosophila yakuba]